MTEVPQDKAFKWVVERIATLSQWSDNPFELPSDLGWDQLGGDYKGRVKRILYYLQDEAKVISVTEKQHADGKLGTMAIKGGLSIHVEVLPSFTNFSKRVLAADLDDNANTEIRLALNGRTLLLEGGGHSHTLHAFKNDSLPYDILLFLIANPNKRMTLSHIKFEANIKGYNYTLPEFVRQIGLGKGSLKDLFFPTRNKSEIELRNPATIDKGMLAELLKTLSATKP